MHSEHIGPSSTVIRITFLICENLHVQSTQVFSVRPSSRIHSLPVGISLKTRVWALNSHLEETIFFYFDSLKLKRILERSQSFSL